MGIDLFFLKVRSFLYFQVVDIELEVVENGVVAGRIATAMACDPLAIGIEQFGLVVSIIELCINLYTFPFLFADSQLYVEDSIISAVLISEIVL